MRLALYGVDTATEENLKLILIEATKRWHQATLVTGSAPPKLDALLNPRPDVLLTGLSSVPNDMQETSLGIKATEQRVPWVVIADTHRSFARPWIQKYASTATSIVASPGERQEAIEFGFRNAIYCGGPPAWREFLELEPVSLERKSPDEKLILVPGSKDASIADHITEAVVTACENVFGTNWRLIFKPHPKERQETVDADRRAGILAQAPLLATDAPTNNLIASVDCSVFNPGAIGATVAGHLRKPTICFRDDKTSAYLEELTGSTEWYPADHGACISADIASIREALLKACSEEGARELAENQKRIYPSAYPNLPKPECRIMDFLERLND